MSITYAQKSETAQKKDASSAASVLDKSSQNESLQRKAYMANNAAQRAEATNDSAMLVHKADETEENTTIQKKQSKNSTNSNNVTQCLFIRQKTRRNLRSFIPENLLQAIEANQGGGGNGITNYVWHGNPVYHATNARAQRTVFYSFNNNHHAGQSFAVILGVGFHIPNTNMNNVYSLDVFDATGHGNVTLNGVPNNTPW